jgi:VIT1/CCC1 family predicted Fe2+/Mn2+ transporter
MSMAAGEYVSVSSQSDIEQADLARERDEQRVNPDYEHAELSLIYRQRGLDPQLADEVAHQLMRHDALDAHARDELGISASARARPRQAAATSGLTFSIGAALPLATAWFSPMSVVVPTIAVGSLLFLGALGGLAARTGGASVSIGVARVTFWGAMAMAATAGIGGLIGSTL